MSAVLHDLVSDLFEAVVRSVATKKHRRWCYEEGPFFAFVTY